MVLLNLLVQRFVYVEPVEVSFRVFVCVCVCVVIMCLWESG